MTLTGIFKNILLVVASVMIWHTNITGLQALGYSIATVGMAYYSLGWDQIRTNAVFFATWARAQWNAPLEEPRLSPLVRRALFLVGLVVVTFYIGYSLLAESSEPVDASDASWSQSWLSYFGLGSST